MPRRARKAGHRSILHAQRRALETLLTTMQPSTPEEGLALFSMGMMQVSQLLNNTDAEPRKVLAFKAATALSAAADMFMPAIKGSAGEDVLVLVERYASGLVEVAPEPEPAAA